MHSLAKCVHAVVGHLVSYLISGGSTCNCSFYVTQGAQCCTDKNAPYLEYQASCFSYFKSTEVWVTCSNSIRIVIWCNIVDKNATEHWTFSPWVQSVRWKLHLVYQKSILALAWGEIVQLPNECGISSLRAGCKWCGRGGCGGERSGGVVVWGDAVYLVTSKDMALD